MRALAYALFIVTSCLGMVSAAAADDPPVLGKKGLVPYGTGWGTAHPRMIFNGGAPAGSVSAIRWRHWGAATATGVGRQPIYRPGGGYYAKPVRAELRASRLGRCPGSSRRAYTRLITREQTRPGGPLDDWSPWALDLCDFNAEPAPCGSVSFAPDNGDGAFEIVAWDTDCQTAQAVATDSKSIPVDPGPHADGMADYRLKSQGFTCSGHSSDDDQPPKIGWSCLRGTAVVRFSAIVTRAYGPPVACTEKVAAGVAEALSKCFRISGQVARSTDPVRINGVDLVPVGGAEIAIDLRRKLVTTRGEVEIKLGWVRLARRQLRVDVARPSSFKVKAGKEAPADIAGLPLKGSAELRFEGGRTIATASVELPSVVKSKGKHRRDTHSPTVEIGLQADNVAGLRPETIGAKWPWLRLPGGFELTDVELKYTGTPDAATGQVQHSFEGGGTLWLRGVNPKGIEAKVKIASGGVFEVTAAVENLNKQLWRVVYLQKLGFTFGVNPLKLGAAVGITAGPQIKVPTRPPFRISRIDGDLTWTNDDPDTWKITGTGDFALAAFEGELTVTTTGKADLKGDVVYATPFAEKYGIRGHVEGWLEGGDPEPAGGGGGGSWGDGAALLQGRVHMSMPGFDAGNAEAVLSSEGVAACRRGVGPDFGFGYTWAGGLEVMAKSCGLGPWTPARPNARAAQVGGAVSVRVPEGRRLIALRVDGAGAAGAPLVTVTGPGGLRVDTPPTPDAGLSTPKAVVVKDSARNTTYVAIDRPARGAYTVTPAAGSPPIAAIQSAHALPSVRVRARVRSRGKRRALRYRIANLAGARVHFVEQGGDARRVIATTRKRRGSVRFRSAPGSSRRRWIVAIVVRDGLVQATRVVARYRA
jgi:hypothetical protein